MNILDRYKEQIEKCEGKIQTKLEEVQKVNDEILDKKKTIMSLKEQYAETGNQDMVEEIVGAETDLQKAKSRYEIIQSSIDKNFKVSIENPELILEDFISELGCKRKKEAVNKAYEKYLNSIKEYKDSIDLVTDIVNQISRMNNHIEEEQLKSIIKWFDNNTELFDSSEIAYNKAIVIQRELDWLWGSSQTLSKRVWEIV